MSTKKKAQREKPHHGYLTEFEMLCLRAKFAQGVVTGMIGTGLSCMEWLDMAENIEYKGFDNWQRRENEEELSGMDG